MMAGLFLLISFVLYGQNLKPYTIGAYMEGDIKAAAAKVEKALGSNGFEVVGAYMPVADSDRWVITYTSDDIKNAVNKTGGLTGFASAWRVALTNESGKITVSYPTPEYWANAYFRDMYPKVKDNYDTYAQKIKKALATCGEGGGMTFGSNEGHDIDKLRNYKYMAGMPKFDKTKKLNTFASFEEAVAVIDGNLSKGVSGLEKVYEVALPGKKLKLYGIGLKGEKGETKFMPKIDLDTPKHTAFLPYEILVVDNEVHMLHGRFRIALSFPDLKMGQFMKIVSTPPDIKKMMETATY